VARRISLIPGLRLNLSVNLSVAAACLSKGRHWRVSPYRHRLLQSTTDYVSRPAGPEPNEGRVDVWALIALVAVIVLGSSLGSF